MLENLNIRPTCFKDAHTLLVEFQKLSTQEFDPKLTQTQAFLENTTTTNSLDKSAKFFDAQILDKVSCMEERLKHTSHELKLQLELTGNFLHICETCYKMCDEVRIYLHNLLKLKHLFSLNTKQAYDWALNCLKLTSSLKKFLATLDSSSTIVTDSAMDAARNFRGKLENCLTSNPKNDKSKMARMHKVVHELQDERLILQCQVTRI